MGAAVPRKSRQGIYLACAHCRCEFLATTSQIKHARAGESVRSYCSRICQYSGEGARKLKPMPYTAICPECGKNFGSRYPKRYCSMKCYVSSGQFKEMIRANASKANAAYVIKMTGKPPAPSVEVKCLNCGRQWIDKPSRKRKFCNHRCYRAYMAGRFDRWIASPQLIALPQSYDEFLCQETLPCLVDGCEWVGKSLGNHVNFAHGIPAAEFKRAAGFNITTGLVTPEVSEAMSERPHYVDMIGVRPCMGPPSAQPLTRGYQSLEGREHAIKTRVLLGSTVKLPERICANCGKQYEPVWGAWNSRYCTTECRDAFYAKNGDPKTQRARLVWLQCHRCSKDFHGSNQQVLGDSRGKPVFCSTHCRQIHNGKKAGEARHKRYLEKLAGEKVSV